MTIAVKTTTARPAQTAPLDWHLIRLPVPGNWPSDLQRLATEFNADLQREVDAETSTESAEDPGDPIDWTPDDTLSHRETRQAVDLMARLDVLQRQGDQLRKRAEVLGGMANRVNTSRDDASKAATDIRDLATHALLELGFSSTRTPVPFNGPDTPNANAIRWKHLINGCPAVIDAERALTNAQGRCEAVERLVSETSQHLAYVRQSITAII